MLDLPDNALLAGSVLVTAVVTLLLTFLLTRSRLLRKQSEIIQQQIKNTEDKYKLITDNAADVIYVYDSQGYITYVSPSVEQLLGFTPEERIGRRFDEISAVDASAGQKFIENAHAGLVDEVNLETKNIAKDGRAVWTEQHIRAVRADDGTVESFHVVMRDITARRAVESRLLESEKRYRLISENTADVIYVYDAEGRITYVSPAIKTVLGFEPEERIGQTFKETSLSPEAMKRVGDLWAQAAKGHVEGGVYEIQQAKKDGTPVWTEVNARVLRNSDGSINQVYVALRDITSRRTAEAALRESEERYRLLTERSVDPIVSFDADGVITYASPAAEQLWGLPIKRMIGLRFDQFTLDQESLDRAEKIFTQMREGIDPVEPIEVLHTKLDGTAIYSEVRIWPYRAVDGPFQGWQFMARDVTERKKNLETLKRQQARLTERAQQLTDLNQKLDNFSATVSHDLRAPLRRIAIHLKEASDAHGDTTGKLEAAQNEAFEMTALSDHILTRSRAESAQIQRSEVDVGTVVRKIVKNASLTSGRSCELDAPAAKAHMAWVEPKLFEMLMTNLIENAYKYTPSNRNLMIKVSVHQTADNISYHVLDNGDGFPSEDPALLFDKYVQGAGNGSGGFGIGLSTVDRVVTFWNGFLLNIYKWDF